MQNSLRLVYTWSSRAVRGGERSRINSANMRSLHCLAHYAPLISMKTHIISAATKGSEPSSTDDARTAYI